MSNIVISTHWTDGDVIPFVRMGEVLKKRGHKVTLLTHCYYEKMARDAGLEFTAWDTFTHYENLISDMAKYNYTEAGSDEIHTFREKYESIAVRLNEFQKIKQHCLEKDTIILAKNRSSIAALMAAELFELPIVLFFMNMYEMESMSTFDCLYKEQLKNEANELRKQVGLPPIDSWLAWQRSPKMQLALWPEWFSAELPEWPTEIKTVGFPLKKQRSISGISDSILEILKDDTAPILITGGTSKQIRKDFYTKAIEACEMLGKKTIVVTRYKELLPTVLPQNVVWFEHVPLDDILPFMGVIIHHGGIGTTSGSIYAAVPQLVLAYHVDRPLNARKVRSLGLGEYLPPSHWDTKLITDKIKSLLNLDYKNKCLKFRNELPEDNALDEVCRIVESIAGKKEYVITYNQITRDIHQENPYNAVNEESTGGREDKKRNLLQNISPEMRKLLLKKMEKNNFRDNFT